MKHDVTKTGLKGIDLKWNKFALFNREFRGD